MDCSVTPRPGPWECTKTGQGEFGSIIMGTAYSISRRTDISNDSPVRKVCLATASGRGSKEMRERCALEWTGAAWRDCARDDSRLSGRRRVCPHAPPCPCAKIGKGRCGLARPEAGYAAGTGI